MNTSPSPQTSKTPAESQGRDVVDQVQTQIRSRYRGRYAVLVKRLGPGWYKQKLSRVLNSKNPGTVEFLAVAYAAGIALGPLLQHIST